MKKGQRALLTGLAANIFSWVTPYPWWNDAIVLVIAFVFTGWVDSEQP